MHAGRAYDQPSSSARRLVAGGPAAAGVAELDEPIVRPGPGQIAVLDAAPGADVRVLVGGDAVIAEGAVDLPGRCCSATSSRAPTRSSSTTPATSPRPTSPSPGSTSRRRRTSTTTRSIDPGYGYLTVRDGTTLSVNVVLPGDAADGPFPTVVEYSGYDPSDPTGSGVGLAAAGHRPRLRLGRREHARQRLQRRLVRLLRADPGAPTATTPSRRSPPSRGCRATRSGWSASPTRASASSTSPPTQPPSLLAITPLSVVDSSALYTLYPGGILNDGFALELGAASATSRPPRSARSGRRRGSTAATTCAARTSCCACRTPGSRRRSATTRSTATSPAKTDVRPLLADIEVPVFLAGAWQDEQTGGHFANMLDGFTGTDHFYASLTNGLHTESLSAGDRPALARVPRPLRRRAGAVARHAARRSPRCSARRSGRPTRSRCATTASPARPTTRRWPTFEADAADPGALRGRRRRRGPARADAGVEPSRSTSWPVPEAVATAWYLGADGTLGSDTVGRAAIDVVRRRPGRTCPRATSTRPPAATSGRSTPSSTGSPSRRARRPASCPSRSPRDTIVMGSGSADLWISADAADTDLEVTLTEVRPDGTEVLVQSGWLRASHRALDEAASTELHPVQTHLEADAAPLPAGELVPIRVDIYPFAHPFRAGSQLRVTDRRPRRQPPDLALGHDQRRRDGDDRPRRRAPIPHRAVDAHRHRHPRRLPAVRHPARPTLPRRDPLRRGGRGAWRRRSDRKR